MNMYSMKYFIFFIDDYSIFTLLYHKKEELDIFKIYKFELEK